MHFPGPLVPLSLPFLFSRASTVCFLPYPTTFVTLANPLSVSLPFSSSLFPRFFCLLSRALITNFSLFSRNSRSNEQLFRTDSGGFSSACSSSIDLPSLFSSSRNAASSFFFFIQSPPTIHLAVRFRCSYRLRSTSAKGKYTQSRAERRIGKSCNAPLSIRRLPPLFCLFIRLFNSLSASDRFRNVICQRLWSAMYPRKYTSDGNVRKKRVQSGVALSQYRIVKIEILPVTKFASRLIPFLLRKERHIV